jgi:hypothetical protein
VLLDVCVHGPLARSHRHRPLARLLNPAETLPPTCPKLFLGVFFLKERVF